MNFDNEKLSPHLYKIDSSKLLLLDFGKFDKKDYSYVCQDLTIPLSCIGRIERTSEKISETSTFISRRHQTPP